MGRRIWGVLLALVAVGLLGTAAMTKSWWQGRGASMGPVGAEICAASSPCKSGDLPEVGGFRSLGSTTMAAMLGTALFALVIGFAAWSKKPIRGLAIFTALLGLGVLGVAAAFVAKAPGKSNEYLGWGAYVGFAGGLFALLGGWLIASWSRGVTSFAAAMMSGAPATARTLMSAPVIQHAGPEAATISPGAMMSAPAAPPRAAGKGALIPPCPRCHGPTQFAQQFKSWFCPRCQSYVAT